MKKEKEADYGDRVFGCRVSRVMEELDRQPGLFARAAHLASDMLGISPVEARNLADWLERAGIVETGTSTHFTKNGRRIYENDPYLELSGTWWYLHRTLSQGMIPREMCNDTVWEMLDEQTGQGKVAEDALEGYYDRNPHDEISDIAEKSKICTIFPNRYNVHKGIERFYYCMYGTREQIQEEIVTFCEEPEKKVYQEKYPMPEGFVVFLEGEDAEEHIENAYRTLSAISFVDLVILYKRNQKYRIKCAGINENCETVQKLYRCLEKKITERYREYPVINMEELINGSMPLTVRNAEKRLITGLLEKKSSFEYGNKYSLDARMYKAIMPQWEKVVEGAGSALGKVRGVVQHFLDSSVGQEQSIAKLYKTLQEPPFGMRKGMIPILLALCLRERSEDAMILDGTIEYMICGEIIENTAQEPERYSVYIEKERPGQKRYLLEIADVFLPKGGEPASSFEWTDAVTAGIIGWYRQLPMYTWEMGNKGKMGTETKLFCRLCQRQNRNAFSFIYHELPEIFSDDYDRCISGVKIIKTKLEQCCPKLRTHMIEITARIFEKESIDASTLGEMISQWCNAHNIGKGHTALTGKKKLVAEYLCSFTGKSDEHIIEQLARAVMGIPVEYFREESLGSYEKELDSIIRELEGNYEYVKGEKLTVFLGSSTEKKEYAIYKREERGRDRILKNQIRSLLYEMKDVMEAEEQGYLLLRLFQEVVEK